MVGMESLLEGQVFFSSAHPASFAYEAMDARPGPIAAGLVEEGTSLSHLHSSHSQAVNTPFPVTVKISHTSPHSLNSTSSLALFEIQDGTHILIITLSPSFSSPATRLPMPQSQFSEVSLGAYQSSLITPLCCNEATTDM